MYRRTRCSVKHKLGAGYSVGNLEIKSRRSITSYNFTTQSPPLSRALSETQLKARFIVVGYLENRRFLFLVLVFSHRYTFLWIRGYNNPFFFIRLDDGFYECHEALHSFPNNTDIFLAFGFGILGGRWQMVHL